MAAGLSLNGFGGAGGHGEDGRRAHHDGETELDVHGYRPWRFGSPYRDPDFTTAAAREVYKYYYRLRYPLDTDEWGRPQRLCPLHGRLQELGAVFGTKNGWERADYFRPGEAWRRAGADQREFGWTAPPYLDLLREEHRAFRERVGIIDMTSFGKLEVSGPGALSLLERVADNRIDRAVGSIVYTQFLDERGGIVADVTVTRLGEDRFRVVTGAGAVDSDRGWLELARREEDGAVEIRDVRTSSRSSGIWGPRARDVLAGRHRGRRRPAQASRSGAAQEISIGGARGARAAHHVCRRARLRALRRARVGRPGVGPADGRRPAARDRARRLSGARLAPAREGLPVLRDRPDRGRHPATRPGSTSASPGTRTSSGARARGRRNPHGASVPCSSATSATRPSTGARRSMPRASSSGGCGAPATASPSRATSRSATSPRSFRRARQVEIEVSASRPGRDRGRPLYDPENERVRA